MDAFLNFLRNFSDFFNRKDFGNKVALMALGLFVFAGFFAFLMWAFQKDYKVLYTDLNKEDAKKIVMLLEEDNIGYQMENDGQTILIPGDMVNVWRLKLATLGVSFSGTVGYEIFDKQSFGTTNFVQKVNKQRALEGELVKTIKYIEGIKRARVHLNIPESSPFVAQKRPPSASVVLDLKRGMRLTENEIRGIAFLISSAVEGMRFQDVVVLNEKGKKLSENIGDSMTVMTANRLTLESKLNRKYEQQIEEILAKVVGNGHVMAKVSVQMDFTESVSTKTTYDPENTALLSEVVNSQRLNGSRTIAQGIPGAQSNLPGELSSGSPPATQNNVDKNLSTKNFKVPSIVTRSKSPVAVIKSISAAVMIDGKRVPAMDEDGRPVMGDDGRPKTVYKKWSENDLTNFSAIVASTIGIDPLRGDKLVIKNMEFASKDIYTDGVIPRNEAHATNREFIGLIVKYLFIGLIAGCFFLFVARPLVQGLMGSVNVVGDSTPKTLEEFERVQKNQRIISEGIQGNTASDKAAGNVLREKIVSLVNADPAKVAQIVHEMMNSNKRKGKSTV